MQKRSRWLVGCCLALAVWLSDRWAWVLPALIGVLFGVAISQIHRRSKKSGTRDLPVSELSSLMILSGFLYLYVFFLLFEMRRTEGRVSPGLVLGLVCLLAVLVGLVAVFLMKVKVPRWLSKVWRRLLEER